jgi:hypothetical protein
LQRRVYPRVSCAVPIVVVRDSPRMLSSALMLNYSKGGVYFEISSPLDTGSYVMVKTDDAPVFDSAGFGSARQCRAEVRWCMEIEISGAKRYGCGVQFINNEKILKTCALEDDRETTRRD